MAKILVTGSKGTLGSRLVEVLQNLGHEVWEVDLQHHLGEKYIRADISE
ncbi:MAG: NAD-dependent epimerase/dehydratase family protein, partial [Desulfitobacteriaceae bacterium]